MMFKPFQRGDKGFIYFGSQLHEVEVMYEQNKGYAVSIKSNPTLGFFQVAKEKIYSTQDEAKKYAKKN